MTSTDKSQIRNAATVVLLRDAATRPAVLMGQRGAKAAFMPNKFVFPGGAVDAADADIALRGALNPTCMARLGEDADPALAPALLVAAIREVWEETGLILGQKSPWPGTAPADWATYAKTGYRPDASGFSFIFRAITPPGRPRRFDARFFLADADTLKSDPDDFTHASDELSSLQWIPIDEVRSFNLPFITEVVLAEVKRSAEAGAAPATPPATVPFFRNDDEESLFLHLKGEGAGGLD